MIESVRSYYYFILGAAGSLTGWYLTAMYLSTVEQLRERAIFGALLGGFLGLALAAYDGLKTRSIGRFMRYGSIGLITGGVAGAFALMLAEYTLGEAKSRLGQSQSVWGSLLIRLFCWLMFAAVVGLGAVINKGTQLYKGVLGGLVGGLLGGLLYEIPRITNHGQSTPSIITPISLALLGGAVGCSVALVTTALRKAWIEVTDGKMKGETYDLSKFVDPRMRAKSEGVIGSGGCFIRIPGDPGVQSRHAKIHLVDGAPTLTVIPEAQKTGAQTFVNGRNIPTSVPLSNGDRIRVGSTTLLYRHKRR